jgi:hypothetical protein
VSTADQETPLQPYFEFRLTDRFIQGDTELQPTPPGLGPLRKGGGRAGRTEAKSGAAADIANQFLLFHLTPTGIREPSEVPPATEGSEDAPDMLVAASLEAFQMDHSDLRPGDSATVRFTMGKDPSSTDRNFDNAFWCIAAGLRLFDDLQSEPASAPNLRTDFKKAFGSRPIEIPGSLAVMSFEIVRHGPEAWWQRIFNFLESGTGKALTSALGFPAITHAAIEVIDELVSRFQDNAGSLLKSRPMTFALSQRAMSAYTSSNPQIRMASLNPGWSLIARGADYARLTRDGPGIRFYSQLGVIAPEGLSLQELIAAPDSNPYHAMTYGLLRIDMKPTQLDPKFNYG